MSDDEIYEVDHDVVVLGTGIKECILSGLFSLNKLKVLNVDRNTYYGGESASLNLEQLYKKFGREDSKVKESLGQPHRWNVDLCPKFIMACGAFVKMLIQTKVTLYFDLASVGGSFVYDNKKIHKVPSTSSEALSSSLLGFFEKYRYKNFIEFIMKFNINDKSTYNDIDPHKWTAADLYDKYSLSTVCSQFTGHCVALFHNDDYLTKPAIELIDRCRLYMDSLAQYGQSAFIYPHFGIGGIPEAFARVCAVNGGVQMLNTDVESFEYDADGKVCGVYLTGHQRMIKTKAVLADPSFALKLNKVKVDHKIIRSVCIFKQQPNASFNQESCQIIIPAKQVNRKNDIYIAITSDKVSVTPRNSGFSIAVISTVKEGTSSDVQNLEGEIAAAIASLGNTIERFTWESDHYVPIDDGEKDNIFVTSSLDETSHLEAATKEVINIYPRMTHEQLDLEAMTSNLKSNQEE